MCFKQTHQERQRRDARREQKGPERPELWRNVRPRGNQAADARDLKRSGERLEAVLGR